MPRNKRVFPFFLDGGIQTVTGTGSTAWNGTSSFVEFTGTGSKTITVGSTDEYNRPIPHGTMVVVKRTQTQVGGSTLTVDPSSEFSTSDTSITLSGAGDHVLLLWKSPSATNDLGEWVELTFYNDDSDFSGDLNVAGSLDSTGDFSVNTDKFAVTASNGNTSVAGNLTITGSSNFKSKVLSSGGAPTVTVTSSAGTCAVTANSTDTAIKLTFGGTWANTETATIAFASSYSEAPVIATNLDPAINGSFSVDANELTFTATGTCANDADIVVIGIRS